MPGKRTSSHLAYQAVPLARPALPLLSVREARAFPSCPEVPSQIHRMAREDLGAQPHSGQQRPCRPSPHARQGLQELRPCH